MDSAVNKDSTPFPPPPQPFIPSPKSQNPPNLRPDLARATVPDARRIGQPTIGIVSLGCPKALALTPKPPPPTQHPPLSPSLPPPRSLRPWRGRRVGRGLR